MNQPTIDRLAPAVRKDFEQFTQPQHRALLTTREAIETIPAQFKRRFVIETLKQPWDGLTELERQGLALANMATGGAINLPALLDVLEAGMDRTSTFSKPIPLPTHSNHEELLAFMIGSLEQASLQRDKALRNLTEAEKHFLFLHARSIVEHFTPQISSLSNQAREQVKADLRFAELLEGKVDYARLIATAQALARLANERWLYQAATAWTNPLPASAVPPGVTGDVLMVRETCYGLIIIGGPGPNTYEIDKGIGLIIDMGGNDLYRGMIAASTHENHGNAVVIDLTGNDTYTGAPLGLATGRLGVRLLIDHDGDDEHQAARYGHGASAHFGVGLFIDHSGDDRYGSSGPFYNGGVAWDNSVSLMIDAGKGQDIYSFERSTGLGRADYAGWGLFIDEGGEDQYLLTSGFGDSSEQSVSGFFDLEGHDIYAPHPDSSMPLDTRPGNGKLFLYPQGGTFIDR